jgi:hypothetical protein
VFDFAAIVVRLGGGIQADPDAIGPDGTVRLRCYLPLAASV